MTLFQNLLPNIKCKIRFMQAMPTLSNIDIYANGELLGKNLSFSNITPYLELLPGSYDVQLYESGTYDSPLLSNTIDLTPNSTLTISIVLINNKLDFFVLQDTNLSTTVNKTFLRFINLSPNSSLLSLSLTNDVTLFDEVEYLERTQYAQLPPGIYNYLLTFEYNNYNKKYINNINLNNGSFYTIYILGLLNGHPKLGYLITSDF